MSKVLRDTRLIFMRSLLLTLRNPVWILIGIMQPVLYLALYAPLLGSLPIGQGLPSASPFNIFVPGLLVQLAMFSTFSGFGLIAELRAGVIERFRVTPVSRVALLLGRALRDIMVLGLQSLSLLLLSIPFGLKATVVGLIVMLGLVGLIGLGMSSICYAAALALRSEDAYAPLIFTVSLPLLLLSGVLLPLTLAPGWLQTVADFNPLSYAVTAARDMFNGNAGDPAVVKGLLIMLALSLIGVGIGARAFNRAVA
jgi:ABC-2 type transport system permease protein